MRPTQVDRDLSFLCWLMTAALLVLAVRFSFQQSREKDFVYFYGIGRMLNTHQPLYDVVSQQRTFESVQKSLRGAYGPSPYPPFVAFAFRPLARLPFQSAYHLWMATSACVYVVALNLLFPSVRRRLAVPLAISCWPFLARTLFNGQLSAIGFLAMALAVHQAGRNHPYRSGLVLSICLYKPTLLVLIVPMLLIACRWRILLGFVGGAGVLVGLTTLFLGAAIWQSYFRFLSDASRYHGALDRADYLHLAAWMPSVLAFTIEAAAICFLISLWWRNRRASADRLAALWAVTLTWSLLLNAYVPIYDAVLAIIGIAFTAPLLDRLIGTTASASLNLGLWVASFFAHAIAAAIGFQILGSLLLAVAILQTVALTSLLSSTYFLCPPKNQQSFGISLAP